VKLDEIKRQVGVQIDALLAGYAEDRWPSVAELTEEVIDCYSVTATTRVVGESTLTKAIFRHGLRKIVRRLLVLRKRERNKERQRAAAQTRRMAGTPPAIAPVPRPACELAEREMNH
jgi:hypothetical protein